MDRAEKAGRVEMLWSEIAWYSVVVGFGMSANHCVISDSTPLEWLSHCFLSRRLRFQKFRCWWLVVNIRLLWALLCAFGAVPPPLW